MAGIGFVKGLGSLDKLINGEDLTTEDLQNLMYGVMAATGLTKRGIHAANEASLAKQSHPGVEPPSRSTKFKNADGTEDTLTFTDSEIGDMTVFYNRGDAKSKKKLVELIRKQKPNIPDEEINRILSDPNALKELGLVHETHLLGNRYSAVKPEKAPS